METSSRKFQRGNRITNNSKRDAILEAQKEEQESPLCYIDGHLSSQECRVSLLLFLAASSSESGSFFFCLGREPWDLHNRHWDWTS